MKLSRQEHWREAHPFSRESSPPILEPKSEQSERVTKHKELEKEQLRQDGRDLGGSRGGWLFEDTLANLVGRSDPVELLGGLRKPIAMLSHGERATDLCLKGITWSGRLGSGWSGWGW